MIAFSVIDAEQEISQLLVIGMLFNNSSFDNFSMNFYLFILAPA